MCSVPSVCDLLLPPAVPEEEARGHGSTFWCLICKAPWSGSATRAGGGCSGTHRYGRHAGLVARSSSPAPPVGSPTKANSHVKAVPSGCGHLLEGREPPRDISFQHVLSMGSGMGALLRPCVVIGVLREVSWPRPPTLLLEGLCSHVGNWVREMIQLKAVPSSKEKKKHTKKAGFKQAGSQGLHKRIGKRGVGRSRVEHSEMLSPGVGASGP